MELYAPRRNMKLEQKRLPRLILAIVLLVSACATAYSFGSYLSQFLAAYPTSTYPNAAALNTCLLCHTTSSGGSRNSYGTAWAAAGYSFSAIESADSDGDGYTNIQEITAGTFPGDLSSHPIPATYTIGGSLSGLSSGSVVLQNNGGGNLTLSANGAFAFATKLASGTAYNVTVLTQPAGQSCSVTNGTGTVGSANVTNVAVACTLLTPTTYTIGGSLSGLSSGSVVLQNNGGGNLTLSANGTFAFAAKLASGTAYNVTVLTQPSGQSCSVTNGTGTVGSANVTNVAVSCQSIVAMPSITITLPTSSSTYTTNSSPLDISGATTGGANITSVTWANLTGGNGNATTTTSWSTWSVSGIPLQSGINVITVTAKDAAGNSGTDTLTVTYNAPDNSGDDLSGMKLWEGKWLKLSIVRAGSRGWGSTAYMEILSWDSALRILRTKIYSPDSDSKSWGVTALPLRYTSGDPLRFLFTFDFAGYYGFSGSLSGTADSGGTLVAAKLRAQGVYLSREKDDQENDDDRENTSSIRGILIQPSQVPQQVLRNGSGF